jgi:hypothetical protein
VAPASYGPFRLVVLDAAARAELVSDGVGVRVTVLDPDAEALLFTSSGLGDHLVEGPRRELFEGMLRSRGLTVGMQDEFHQHQWPQRPHHSVRMRRADAGTVSTTVVEMREGRVTMKYLATGGGAESMVTLSLRVGTCG